MNNQQVKEAVKGCKCLLSRLVSISRDTHSVDHVDFLHLEVLINLAQSYLSASELGEEVHGKHDHCFDIDGDFCIKCGEDVDIHPAYVRGYNSALSHARLVVAKLKAQIAELRKALYEMIEWHPKITQRIGAEGSEARYIQAHQEDAIKFATALLANKENK